MKARGLDAKTRLRARHQAYPSISGFYAAFATGETDVLIGGPTILQKLYQEGVPLRIIGTGFTLADLVDLRQGPGIKSLADLKGKQLAIDMGGSQFQVIKIYANAKGIDLGKDITVVNANFAVARAQLEAGRVDAALVIEPLASIIARQNPGLERHLQRRGGMEGDHRRRWLGDRARHARGGDRARIRTRRRCCLRRCRMSPMSCHTNTDVADKIANETLKLPPGILTAAVDSKRLQMIVKPAWEPATRKSITDMMERAVKAGFYQNMPDEKIIYAP